MLSCCVCFSVMRARETNQTAATALAIIWIFNMSGLNVFKKSSFPPEILSEGAFSVCTAETATQF